MIILLWNGYILTAEKEVFRCSGLSGVAGILRKSSRDRNKPNRIFMLKNSAAFLAKV